MSGALALQAAEVARALDDAALVRRAAHAGLALPYLSDTLHATAPRSPSSSSLLRCWAAELTDICCCCGAADALDAFLDGVRLGLAKVPNIQLLCRTLDLDEGFKLLVNPYPVVGEFAPDRVLGCEVVEFVVSETHTQNIGHKKPSVPLIGVSTDEVVEGFCEFPD